MPLYILLGAAGLIAVARDTEPHSLNWGLLIWAAGGGFVGQSLLNVVLGIAEDFPLLWGTALAFLLAALLADYRRGRLHAIVISLLGVVLTGFISFYSLAAILSILGIFS